MSIETEIVNSVSGTAKLIEYGVLGVFCVFLMIMLGYFIKAHKNERKELHKCHAEERKAWKETTEKQFEETNAIGQKVVEVTSEIKGMINSKNSNL